MSFITCNLITISRQYHKTTLVKITNIHILADNTNIILTHPYSYTRVSDRLLFNIILTHPYSYTRVSDRLLFNLILTHPYSYTRVSEWLLLNII